MVNKLKGSGISNIIIITPPPVDEGNFRYKEGARTNQRLKKYAEAAVGVARGMGLPYVDLFNGFQVGWSGGGGVGRQGGQYCPCSHMRACVVCVCMRVGTSEFHCLLNGLV